MTDPDVVTEFRAVSPRAIPHVVCRRCGTTADVGSTVGAAPFLTPSQSHGFVVDEAEIVFRGLCPTCRGLHPRDHHHEEDSA